MRHTPRPEHVVHSDIGGIFYEPKAGAEALLEMGCRFSHVEWASFAWPGGYPVYYTTKDGGCLCLKCANDNLFLTLNGDDQWRIVGQDINYEDPHTYCDSCREHITPAYWDDERR